MGTGNPRRLAELGMPVPLAKEVATQITAGAGNRRRLIELGVVPALARRLQLMFSGSSIPAAKLAELGMVPPLATEIAKQVASTPTPTPVPTPTPTPLIAAVDPEGGWGQWASGTPVTGGTVATQRQGYDAAGATTTIAETRNITFRLPQMFPNQALDTTDRVVFDDLIYSTDTIAGVTNNSAVVSPKPICNVITIDQQIVGNFIGGTLMPVEVVALHRNGMPPSVLFTFTDGTNSVSVRVAGSTRSPRATDRFAVEAYCLPLTDITALNDNAVITMSVSVPPRIGGPASIASTADSAVAREFSPRYYFKNTSKAANPPFAYINATTGVDATVNSAGMAGGITKISTTAATAAANPFAGWASLMSALVAASGVTGGNITGCIVRVQGTVPFSANFAVGTYTPANGGSCYIEGDPLDVNATITFGAVTPNIRGAMLHVRNIKMARTLGTLPFGPIRFENVALDNNSVNVNLSNSSTMVDGMVLTNANTACFNAGASIEARLLRGIAATGGPGCSLDAWLVVGCDFDSGVSFVDITTRRANGAILAFNRSRRIGGSFFLFGQTWSLSQLAIVQNDFEYIAGVTTDTTRVSGDIASGSIDHAVIVNNTMPGFGICNRKNWWYVDGAPLSAAQGRVHSRCLFAYNIIDSLNIKGATFVGTNNSDGGGPDPTNAPNCTGNRALRNGVGVRGNMTMASAANGEVPAKGASFAPEYAGLYSISGTSTSVMLNPVFVNYQGITSNAPSTGGGNQRVTTGSPCIGAFPAGLEFLPRDLDGATRDRGTIGAYR